MRIGRRAQRGVTLMELLVVISLLGLISLAMLFSLRIGISSWQRADARMSVDRRMIGASDLVTAQLANVRAQNVTWGVAEKQVKFLYFDGASDRLRFLSSYSVEDRSRGGVWLAEYWWEHNAEGMCRLLYNEWPYHDDADAAVTITNTFTDRSDGALHIIFSAPVRNAQTRELYTGVHDCGFEYLIEPEGAPVFWGKSWVSNAGKLPRAVALRFRAHEVTGGIAPVATVAALNVREVAQ